MIKLLIYSCSFLLSALIFSCNKEIKSEQGGIDIISNVYFNASKGLNEMRTFHVSKINYHHDSILELLPSMDSFSNNENSYFILNNSYYELGKNPEEVILKDVIKKTKKLSIFEKKEGAIFTNDKIPDYEHKRILKDTILFKKKYWRFEINAPKAYSRYYVYQTDTILPYRIYEHVKSDFKGRIERIDSYNKETDVFVTLQIIPRKELDEQAKDFFAFNEFLKKKSTK